ncbi:MAG TPA: hypothetical protein VIY47_05030, partial [Ignavibacteriaceae bacterium]
MFFWISFSLLLLTITFGFVFKMMGAMVSGWLFYTMLDGLKNLLPNFWSENKKRLTAIGIILFAILAILSGLVGGSISFAQNAFSIGDLMQDMASVLDDFKAILPSGIADKLPPDEAALRTSAADWLREHAQELQNVGK